MNSLTGYQQPTTNLSLAPTMQDMPDATPHMQAKPVQAPTAGLMPVSRPPPTRTSILGSAYPGNQTQPNPPVALPGGPQLQPMQPQPNWGTATPEQVKQNQLPPGWQQMMQQQSAQAGQQNGGVNPGTGLPWGQHPQPGVPRGTFRGSQPQAMPQGWNPGQRGRPMNAYNRRQMMAPPMLRRMRQGVPATDASQGNMYGTSWMNRLQASTAPQGGSMASQQNLMPNWMSQQRSGYGG